MPDLVFPVVVLADQDIKGGLYHDPRNYLHRWNRARYVVETRTGEPYSSKGSSN